MVVVSVSRGGGETEIILALCRRRPTWMSPSSQSALVVVEEELYARPLISIWLPRAPTLVNHYVSVTDETEVECGQKSTTMSSRGLFIGDGWDDEAEAIIIHSIFVPYSGGGGGGIGICTALAFLLVSFNDVGKGKERDVVGHRNIQW